MEGGFCMRIGSTNQNPYEQLATMKKINRAADDPAVMAISTKISSLTTGLDKSTENIQSMNDLANTAEGSLSSINDSLSRMKELTVQASNGTMTMDDKKIIQMEIEGLKSSIHDVAKNTEFNTQKLLDGSFTDKKIASNPSGTGSKMNIKDASLEALGIDKFDVTGNFNMEDIDKAIEKVSDSRAELGATSNSLKSAASVNQVAAENLTAANSKISDTDIGEALMKMNTDKILKQYQYFAQKQTLEDKASSLNMLT